MYLEQKEQIHSKMKSIEVKMKGFYCPFNLHPGHVHRILVTPQDLKYIKVKNGFGLYTPYSRVEAV